MKILKLFSLEISLTFSKALHRHKRKSAVEYKKKTPIKDYCEFWVHVRIIVVEKNPTRGSFLSKFD